MVTTEGPRCNSCSSSTVSHTVSQSARFLRQRRQPAWLFNKFLFGFRLQVSAVCFEGLLTSLCVWDFRCFLPFYEGRDLVRRGADCCPQSTRAAVSGLSCLYCMFTCVYAADSRLSDGDCSPHSHELKCLMIYTVEAVMGSAYLIIVIVSELLIYNFSVNLAQSQR